jgi:hypothetical protein
MVRRRHARLVGARTGGSGRAVYEVKTGVNGGSKLLIFGPSQEGKRP